MRALDRLIKLKPGEGKPFAVLFAYSFCLVALTIAGKSARDTYFLSRYEKTMLPIMFGVGAVAVAMAISAYSAMASRMGARSALNFSNILFGGSLILLQPRVTGWLIPVTYVWVEVITVLTMLQYWLIAPGIFNPRSAKRLYGPIAGGGSLGAIVMGLSLKPFVHTFGSGILLYLVAALVLVSWRLAIVASSFVVEAPKENKPAKKEAPKEPLNEYLVCIAIAISMATIVTTIVDYQFKILASRTFTNEAGLVGFFGSFYAATGASSLLVQFVLSGFVLSRFGVLAGLLVLPILHNVGVFAMLFNPALLSALIAKFSDQTFKFTLTNASMELLWLPVPAHRRIAVKPLISGTIKSFSEGGAGIFMFLVAPLVALQQLSFVVLGALAIWITTILRLRRLYVKEVAQAVESGRINFAELRVDIRDREMVSTIERTLLGESEPQILFALHMIEGLSLQPWAVPLQQLLDRGTLSVRKRVIAMAADAPDVLPESSLIAAIKAGDEASADAMMAAGRRSLPILPLLREMISSSNPPLRAAAAAAMKDAGAEPSREADQVLAEMLASGDPASIAAAIQCLTNSPALLPTEQLISHLNNEDRAVRSAALNALGERADRVALLPIVRSVNRQSEALPVRRLLRRFPDDDVVPVLVSEFAESRKDSKRASALARVLSDYPANNARQSLLEALNPRELDLCEPAAEGLLRSVRAIPESNQSVSEPVAGKIAELGERAYFFTRVLSLLPDDNSAFLLRDYYEHQLKRALTVILRLSAIRNPSLPIETCIQVVQVREPHRLPFVLELLDGVLTQQERRVLYPLIESIPLDERNKLGESQFTSLPGSLEPVLADSIKQGATWIATISLDYTSRGTSSGPANTVEAKHAMYTTLEKAVFLKSVSLFQNIPAERIADIAQVAVETHVAANEVLFREGDHGDSLYIVLSGCVRVHKGEKTLASLTRGACLGEMAVLDQEPRSADVTAMEESTLLRIDQEAFYEVLSQSPELMHGIIRLLTSRLRATGERLAAASAAALPGK